MLIVLDANAITPDYLLTNPTFQVLGVRVEEEVVEVCVPKVVVAEVEGNYRRAIADRLEALDKWCDRTDRLGEWVKPAELRAELEAAAEAYPAKLAARLRELGFKVVHIPDVDHEELVRRAVARRRPFDANGSGYRDTLIWETVLNLAADADDVMLVSGDKAFQDDNTGTLHPDLLKDLVQRGVLAEVQLKEKLIGLVLESLVHREFGGEELQAYVTELQVSLLPEWLEDHVPDEVLDLEVEKRAAGLPPSTEEISINYLEDLRDIALTVLEEVGDGDVLVQFTLTADAELEVVVNQLDAQTWDLHVREDLDDWWCRADVHKPLELRGLVTLHRGRPVALQVSDVHAPDDDPGVWQWEEMLDSCIQPVRPR